MPTQVERVRKSLRVRGPGADVGISSSTGGVRTTGYYFVQGSCAHLLRGSSGASSCGLPRSSHHVGSVEVVVGIRCVLLPRLPLYGRSPVQYWLLCKSLAQRWLL